MTETDLKHKECSCGSKQMTSDYNFKTEELNEFCDVCGYLHIIVLTNKIEDGGYPEDWNPEYEEQEVRTGYVLKAFTKDGSGFISCLDRSILKEALQDLKNDENVVRFAITSNRDGFWQTQIFNKPVLSKFEVTHLIDVVSKNPEDYTIKDIVFAKDEVDAIKKVALTMTDEKSSNIEWIKSIRGNPEEVMKELLRCKYCFTNVIKVD